MASEAYRAGGSCVRGVPDPRASLPVAHSVVVVRARGSLHCPVRRVLRDRREQRAVAKRRGRDEPPRHRRRVGQQAVIRRLAARELRSSRIPPQPRSRH